MFSLITLRCLIRGRASTIALSQSEEEVQPGLLTAALHKSHNQPYENTEYRALCCKSGLCVGNSLFKGPSQWEVASVFKVKGCVVSCVI